MVPSFLTGPDVAVWQGEDVARNGTPDPSVELIFLLEDKDAEAQKRWLSLLARAAASTGWFAFMPPICPSPSWRPPTRILRG